MPLSPELAPLSPELALLSPELALLSPELALLCAIADRIVAEMGGAVQQQDVFDAMKSIWDHDPTNMAGENYEG